MLQARKGNALPLLALVLGGMVAMAGCGAGTGGGGGGDTTPVAELDCTATGHVLSGCWYGNQVRLQQNVGSLSIAIAFDSEGRITGVEQYSANEDNDGIFQVSGEGTATLLEEEVFDVYLIGGPDIDSELYVIPNDPTTPTHFGYVQSMTAEGWIEVGVFQKTKPSVWPPSDTTPFDWETLLAGRDYAGGRATVRTSDEQAHQEDPLDDLYDQIDSTNTGDNVDLSGEDHITISSGTFNGSPTSSGDLTLSADTFNASRGILEGIIIADSIDYTTQLVSSADGLAIAMVGCNDSLTCLNSGDADDFAENLILTWQWLSID